eukprot:364759-Chlamydomonas_euryale.AAC.9
MASCSSPQTSLDWAWSHVDSWLIMQPVHRWDAGPREGCCGHKRCCGDRCDQVRHLQGAGQGSAAGAAGARQGQVHLEAG